jgi:hypothetical protein
VDQQEGQQAQRVLQRAIQAKGGADRLRRVRTVVMKGTITAPGGFTLQATSYIAYPDRFRMAARLPNGDLTQVHAGARRRSWNGP